MVVPKGTAAALTKAAPTTACARAAGGPSEGAGSSSSSLVRVMTSFRVPRPEPWDRCPPPLLGAAAVIKQSDEMQG